MTRKLVIVKYLDTYTEVLDFIDTVERDTVGIYNDYEIEISYLYKVDKYKVRVIL